MHQTTCQVIASLPKHSILLLTCQFTRRSQPSNRILHLLTRGRSEIEDNVAVQATEIIQAREPKAER